MNNTISATELHPTVVKRITALWGTPLFFEYIENVLLVNDNPQDTLSFGAIMELTFLSELHAAHYKMIEKEDTRLNLSDSMILDLREKRERDNIWDDVRHLGKDY